jgi:hypothetical protein
MRRILLATLFFWPCVLAQQTDSPPEVTSAGDAYPPYNVILDGLLVLGVSIGDDGNIQGIEALRNPGAMLGDAKSAVQNWKFQPALEGRKARASRMTVAFVYRPTNYLGFGAAPVKDFTPAIPSAQSDDSCDDCSPVGIYRSPMQTIRSIASLRDRFCSKQPWTAPGTSRMSMCRMEWPASIALPREL